MQRLFVAIRPPAAIRALLLAAMGGVSGARWQSEAQLHLTLRFIGEVDRHLAQDVHAALGTVRQTRFEIALSGVGVFEHRGRPDTIWAGVRPHEPLKLLHKKIDQALARVGVPADQRAYLPHITLARLGHTAGPIRNLMEEQGGLSSPSFEVTDHSLFESRLSPDGAIYTELERYTLV